MRRARTSAPFPGACAEELDRLIQAEGPETVAAFIGEPVLGTGGIIPPPEGYWEEIQKVLKKHDVLLIADEVVCGFWPDRRAVPAATITAWIRI